MKCRKNFQNTVYEHVRRETMQNIGEAAVLVRLSNWSNDQDVAFANLGNCVRLVLNRGRGARAARSSKRSVMQYVLIDASMATAGTVALVAATRRTTYCTSVAAPSCQVQ